jgi:hypothetical protein
MGRGIAGDSDGRVVRMTAGSDWTAFPMHSPNGRTTTLLPSKIRTAQR